MTIYYNAITRPNAPCRFICDIKPADERFIKYFVEKAYPSYDEALEKCEHAGTVYFWDGKKLMDGYIRQPWEFEPVPAGGIDDVGINWATRYFTDKDAVVAFATEHPRNRGITYSDKYDVYSVNYHL